MTKAQVCPTSRAMAEVKICGLSDTYMLRVAAEAGADWVGFVLYPPSPRNLLGRGPDALELVSELSGFAAELGVRSAVLLVDPSAALFEQVLHDIGPDAIQLQGKETPEQVLRYWRDCQGICELWKAIGVATESDLEGLDDWQVDRFLFDAKPTSADALPGGNGEVGAWEVLEAAEPGLPWWLAGGLTVDNVAGAIAATGARAVDVSSGVERTRGVKDEDLIRAFIDAAKFG